MLTCNLAHTQAQTRNETLTLVPVCRALFASRTTGTGEPHARAPRVCSTSTTQRKTCLALQSHAFISAHPCYLMCFTVRDCHARRVDGRLFFSNSLSLDCLRIEFLSRFRLLCQYIRFSFYLNARLSSFSCNAINPVSPPLSANNPQRSFVSFLLLPHFPDCCAQKKAKNAVRPLIALIHSLSVSVLAYSFALPFSAVYPQCIVYMYTTPPRTCIRIRRVILYNTVPV